MKSEEDLKHLLDRHPETRGTLEQISRNEETRGNIDISIIIDLAPFKTLAARWHHASGKFSLNEWMTRESVLVLGRIDAESELFDAINSLLLNRASESLMSQQDGPDTRTFMFLDELATVSGFQKMESLMTTGLSKFVSVILASQGVEGLKKQFGNEATEQFLAMCSNKAFLCLSQPTAEWAAKQIGKTDWLEIYRNWSQTSGTSWNRGSSQPSDNNAALANRSFVRRSLSGVALPSSGTLQFAASDFDAAEGLGDFVVIVERVNGAAGQVSVDYVISGGTATPGLDFEPRSGTLLFEDGQRTASFKVPIAMDDIPEGLETIRLQLQGPQGGAVLGNFATATIQVQDADSLGVIELSAASYSVDEWSGMATITVKRRPGAWPSEVTVNYVTEDITAIAGEDYEAVSGTLTFGAGETVKTITVPIINDAKAEPYELLRVSLTSVSPNAVLGDQSTASIRILASSPKPVLLDIRQGPTITTPWGFVDVDGMVYFIAQDENGNELWKTNGTPAGTARVLPSGLSMNPFRSPINFNGTLFFIATDGAGEGIWKSDGTAEGTVLVKQIHAYDGTSGGVFSQLVQAGELFYFAADDGVSGIELWRSDGTTGGTMIVKDVPAGGLWPVSLTDVNGILYFVTVGGLGELWKSDGTESGTLPVTDLNPGNQWGPVELTNFGGTLYFHSSFLTGNGALWKSNGTAEGTVPVREGVVHLI